MNCKALASITFTKDSQLLEIGQYAFGSTAITEFVMPDTVTVVGDAPFRRCQNLKTVTLSKNLTPVIGGEYGIFYECLALESISVPSGSLNFRTEDGVLYDLAKSVVYCVPAAKDPTGFKLPETLVAIEDYAFYGFRGTTLVIPERVEKIGNFAFENAALTSIHIPRNVVSIGEAAFRVSADAEFFLQSLTFAANSKLLSIGKEAFSGQAGIKSVSLPDGVKTIGAEAFANCTELEDVVLPAALEALETGTFSNCPKIKTFVMQSGLVTIGKSALAGTDKLANEALTELVIPATVTTIGKSAFEYLSALQKVTFAENSQLETLGTYAFRGCSGLESITLPEKLSTIETEKTSVKLPSGKMDLYLSNAFTGCTALKSVDMSACRGLREIPSGMFMDCTGVETLMLPPHLETIPDFAFGDREDASGNVVSGLTSLKEITIPASVTSIGGYAFSGCTSLETVTFADGSKITKLGTDDVLSGNPVWGQNIFAGTTSLKEVVLPADLTLIGIGCFENSAVEKIDLPSTVTHIAARAFKNCDGIVNADISANLQYLGDEAFYDCDNLEEADLNFGLEYLGSYAFARCEKLKNAYIPATVASISGNPFLGCIGLESFALDMDSVDFIEQNGVLYDKTMTKLLYYPACLTAETFQIPDTVTEIAEGAFAGAKFKSVVLSEKIKKIPAYAFEKSNLESITIHKKIIAIDEETFAGAANLKQIFIAGGTAGTIHEKAFANLVGEVNIYFYNHTRDEVVAKIGEKWITGAGEKVTFYFKDTLPEGTVVPA